LQPELVTDYLSLVENDEHDHAYGQNQHAYCSEEQHKGDVTTWSIDLKENHDLGSRMYFGFVRVFENISFKRIIKWVFERLLEVFAFFSRERYCEQDIFDNRGKKIDFPKVISYFFGQVAGLDEQKQGSREVDDKGYDEPEMRFLVNKYYLGLIHLVEQVEY
jgi:hypothetical protein